MAQKSSKQPKQIESLKHTDDTRKNIPTAEYQSVMAQDELVQSGWPMSADRQLAITIGRLPLQGGALR